MLISIKIRQDAVRITGCMFLDEFLKSFFSFFGSICSTSFMFVFHLFIRHLDSLNVVEVGLQEMQWY